MRLYGGRIPFTINLALHINILYIASQILSIFPAFRMTILNDCEKAKYEMSYHVEDSKLDTLEAEMKHDNNDRVTADAAWLTAEKRLVRKLDFTLVSTLWLLYLFNYLDRNNIAQARLNSFEKDSGLVGSKFNVAMSILNVGYMIMQLPSAYGFNNFFSTIVKGMKLGNDTNTLLLPASPYLVANLVAFATAWSSDRREERDYHNSIPQGMVCIGFIVTLATTNNAARYAVAFQERACARAIIAQPVGQYLEPYDRPRFVIANVLMAVSSAISILTCVIMKWVLEEGEQEAE
ncbi:putative Major facilitator superfamily (MFS) profile domain-containing protein [Seiridium unicorne]|uniref:Major facilitator superfamily (MFS) profile domain-containing protein n=1 Tax=Seiridium unicorne TaxID=138068 RepID=A0ABR2V5X1_9PEZI